MSKYSACAAALALLLLPGQVFAGALEDGLAAYERRDYVTAKASLFPLAEQGSAAAQLTVGLMYVKGYGVIPDVDAAQSWFKRAAENPDAPPEVRQDATYNRDFISRKLRNREAADAAVAARQQAEAASRAADADRARKELEEIQWNNERRRAETLRQIRRDSAKRTQALEEYLARSRADQAQRDANYWDYREKAHRRANGGTGF